jgi:hypothetical protein
MIHVANAILYIMGWSLFVAGQAQNSIRSPSNGLTDDFEGWKCWMRTHFLDLANRAFWSGLFYGFIVYSATGKMQAIGFPVTSYMAAGVGGYTANVFIYQVFGVLGYRVEMGEKVPPKTKE